MNIDDLIKRLEKLKSIYGGDTLVARAVTGELLFWRGTADLVDFAEERLVKGVFRKREDLTKRLRIVGESKEPHQPAPKGQMRVIVLF